jgi:hypothetical protein
MSIRQQHAEQALVVAPVLHQKDVPAEDDSLRHWFIHWDKECRFGHVVQYLNAGGGPAVDFQRERASDPNRGSDSDVSIHEPGEPPADAESQSSPAELAGDRFVALSERPKQASEHFRRHADPGVDDIDAPRD